MKRKIKTTTLTAPPRRRPPTRPTPSSARTAVPAPAGRRRRAADLRRRRAGARRGGRRSAEPDRGSGRAGRARGAQRARTTPGPVPAADGRHPLLNREQELALAQRLEHARSRFRHAALSQLADAGRVVETFERVRAGQLALDPTIDVVTTLGLTREHILQRMPHNVPTLQHAARRRPTRTSATCCGDQPAAAAPRLRATLWRKLRKAIALAEELSPRIDLLDRWTDELRACRGQMSELAAADRAARPLRRRPRAADQGRSSSCAT